MEEEDFSEFEPQQELPNDIDELKELLLASHKEVRALQRVVNSQSFELPDADSMADLVSENLELRDELVLCKAAVAEHEFQREASRLRFKRLEDMITRQTKPSLFSEMASSFSARLKNLRLSPQRSEDTQHRLLSDAASTISSPSSRRLSFFGRGDAANTSQDETADNNTNNDNNNNNDNYDDDDDDDDNSDDDDQDSLDFDERDEDAWHENEEGARELTLDTLQQISYIRKLERTTTAVPWGIELDSSVDTSGVWIHSVIGVASDSVASKGGIRQHQALLAIDDKVLFNSSGALVIQLLANSNNTEMELVLAAGDDLLVAIGPATLTLL